MIWGDSDALGGLVRTIGEDPAIGQVLVFYDQPAGLTGAVEESWRAVRDGIIAGARDSPAPTMVASTLPELLDDAAAWRFAQSGVPAVAGLRTGIRCAAAMRTPAGDPGRLREIARVRVAAATGGAGAGDSALAGRARDQGAAARRRGATSSTAAWSPTPTTRRSPCASSAVTIALKLSASSVQHKSELGGVVLGLADAAEVRSAYARLAQLAARARRGRPRRADGAARGRAVRSRPAPTASCPR